MDKITKCQINIAVEILMIIMLSLFLISSFIQKKRFSTSKPLIILTITNIFLLLIQILECNFFIYNYPVIKSLTPNRILYSLDFMLFVFDSIVFYFYITAHLKDLYQDKGIEYKSNKLIEKIMVITEIIVILAAIVSFSSDKFYSIKEGEEFFNLIWYIIIFILAGLPIIITACKIIRHRKILWVREFIYFLSYLIIQAALIINDLINTLCFEYVFMAVFILMLYIHIDLQRGTLLERKEREIVQNEKEMLKKEVMLSDLQTQIMLSQMQPHFLYNILSTISGLAYIEEAPKTKEVVEHFSDYFRANLDSLGKDKFIPFNKELEHIKTYLSLEKVRFEDALNVKYEILATDFMVPSLAIQPIVENAVKHGICQKENGGTITIRTYETKNDNIIEIEDDGTGFDANNQVDDNKSHIGIQNVRERLEVICNGLLEIKSEVGKGTIAKILIPKKYQGEKV